MKLIDADKLLELFDDKERYGYITEHEVREQPTVDAEPAVHAHWKNITRMQFADPLDCKRWFECSNCGMQKQQRIDTMDRDNYCPNCGAKMDEGRK